VDVFVVEVAIGIGGVVQVDRDGDGFRHVRSPERACG
jgi:hypothetical protein